MPPAEGAELKGLTPLLHGEEGTSFQSADLPGQISAELRGGQNEARAPASMAALGVLAPPATRPGESVCPCPSALGGWRWPAGPRAAVGATLGSGLGPGARGPRRPQPPGPELGLRGPRGSWPPPPPLLGRFFLGRQLGEGWTCVFGPEGTVAAGIRWQLCFLCLGRCEQSPLPGAAWRGGSQAPSPGCRASVRSQSCFSFVGVQRPWPRACLGVRAGRARGPALPSDWGTPCFCACVALCSPGWPSPWGLQGHPELSSLFLSRAPPAQRWP